MINFHLIREKLIPRNLSNDLLVVQTESEYILQECINMFNSEIKWDGMFSIKDTKERFEMGDKFFAAYYEGKLFGYCWLSNENNIYKVYNVFSKKTDYHRKYGATDVLYYVIKNYTNGTVIAEVDEWNTKSINVFNKLGFNNG